MVWLVYMLALGACTPPRTVVVTAAAGVSEAPLKTVVVTARAVKTPTRIETEERTPVGDTQATKETSEVGETETASYRLEATLDYGTRTLEVVEKISYHHGAPLKEILLVVDTARHEGVFELLEGKVDGKETKMNIEGMMLSVPLEETKSEGDKVELELKYRLRPVNAARKMGFTEYVTNFGDWYPFVPEFDPNDGWLIYAPGNTGEYLTAPAAEFTFQLRIAGAPEGLVVAASTPMEFREGVYSGKATKLRNFSWSVSPLYQSVSGEAKGVDITSYYFRRDQAAGERALETAQQAVNLFTEMFGAPQIQSLALVEGEFVDGMEYHGLYFLGQEYYNTYGNRTDSYLVALTAHETAHQWFAGLVGNNAAMEPWLDEALSTYAELLFFENYYPELVDWWWNYRVQRFAPQGWVNGNVYDFSGFRDYVDAVYLRGALWLDNLREKVSEDQFRATLAGYVEKHQWGITDAKDFFQAVEEAGGTIPEDLLSVYFRKSGDS